jgi:hypothetical protein
MSWLLLFVPSVHATLPDDPFVEWDLPKGQFGPSYGILVADADGDGFTDIVVPYAEVLWLNDAAKGWIEQDVDAFGEHSFQYGASFGDYNADGLPDIATEPRGSDSALLFRNDGDGEFTPVDTDHFPEGPSSAKGGDAQQAETNAWVDADGDGFLDLFVPAYYGNSGFYQNNGPDGTGEHEFEEMAVDIGIVLSPTSSLRPEGAQFVDIDRDGDPDLYVCGELLRNESTPGNPQFANDQGGIPDQGFDEGAAFADIDMDGDLDLGVMYNGIFWTDKFGGFGAYGFFLWENMGDGTFRMLDPETVEDWDLNDGGGVFGMSFADWDYDGDMDVTMAGRFEQNQWRETGAHGFLMISTGAAWGYALPAWFDWDWDGDLDVGLGTWGGRARFYTNSLYDGVPEADRKFLRVRPVADSDKVPEGVDTEFGATVEVRVVGEAPEVRRVYFTASGHGYLNQSEYPLSFGLEGVDVPIVDVSVDFVNPSDEGLWRVDKYVNPALGGIDVRTLALPREVRVFRSGAVMIDGKTYPPGTDEFPLVVTPGGLSAPDVDDELTEVEPGTWVGLEVSVPTDADPLRGAALREVVVDGILGAPVTCGKDVGNVMLWDVTEKPTLVAAATGAVLPYNRRVDVATDFELRNGRTYRVMALVTEARSFAAVKSKSWVDVRGALQITPASPCDGEAIAWPTAADDDRTMAIRWRERQLVEKPVDTADTADTGETGDTGTTTDDSGKNGEDSPPPIDAGRNDAYVDDETAGGCSCASGGRRGSFVWLLVGLPWLLRRRSAR